jgi:hypothetical protein
LLNIVGRVLCCERELAATQQNKAILWARQVFRARTNLLAWASPACPRS